jgi:hypothetical protein
MIIFEVLITMQHNFKSSKSAILVIALQQKRERRSIATGSKRQYQLQKNLLTLKKNNLMNLTNYENPGGIRILELKSNKSNILSINKTTRDEAICRK